MNETRTVPWHLWVVGVSGLLFTLIGVNDYVRSQMGDRDYIANAVEPMGIDADAAVEYFSGFPMWVDFVWALGVWGAFAGAVLLLLRNRFAVLSFVVSLVCLVLSNAYSLINPFEGLTDTMLTYGITAFIFLVMIALTYYAYRMRQSGVLR